MSAVQDARWREHLATKRSSRQARRSSFDAGFLAGREARSVSTPEELAALPVGSVVLLGSGQAFVRTDAFRDGMDWQAPGDTDYWGPAAVLAEHPDAPARVLYEGPVR
ncbi:MAG: hypothetical protein K0S70_229 [Microbacterium sp.]|nr:hypothetical protein [Microbacterium sp.]